MVTKPKKVTASQFKVLANLGRKVLPDGRTIHAHKSWALEGAPGMGKTAVIRSIADDWKLPCITVSINQWVNAADIVSFAYKGKQTKDGFELAGEDTMPPWFPVYREAPDGSRVETTDATKGYPVWTNEKGKPEPHPAVVLLDEFSSAKPAVQQAFLCVALDKKVKNFSLHEDTNFFIAFNGARRRGFEGQTNEISAALVGCNGRFDVLELVFEEKPVLDAVRRNPTISNFWKKFAEKYLCKLRIYDETTVNDSNSCGRTFENLLERLSIGGYDSKCWDSTAEMLVEIEFATSPKVAETFINCVSTFDVPTGEDYLNGTAKVDTFSDAVLGVGAMVNLFGFRKRCGKSVISQKELAILKTFMDKDYPTGTITAKGKPIIGSRKELYLILKSALYQENLECMAEFSFVAGVIDSFEEENSSEEECEF